MADGKYRNWNWIVPNKLAQGGYPGAHPGLFQAFDVIVYMAEEGQPKLVAPAGKAVLRGPIDDDVYRPVPAEVGRLLQQLAVQCARFVQQNKSVLITCMEGRNRSGVLMGLTLLKLYPGWPPEQAVKLIKRHRKAPSGPALANTMFEQYLLAQR